MAGILTVVEILIKIFVIKEIDNLFNKKIDEVIKNINQNKI